MSARRPLLAAALTTLVLGMATRPASRYLPAGLTGALGDILWALFVFLLLAGIAPRWERRQVFWATFLFSLTIECSQLYHAAWIDSLRRNAFLGLILGWGFAWEDLVCYTVGAALGVMLRGSPRLPGRDDPPRSANG